MRAIFGILSLLMVVAVVGVLAKKQLGALSVPAVSSTSSGAGVSVPATTPQQHSQQLQQQVKQTVEQTLQQARPLPDDRP